MRDELWLKHDVRSRFDPKMAYFISKEGWKGYGLFWALLEILHYQNDHEFELGSEGPGIAIQLGIGLEEFNRIITHLIECGLFKLEGDVVFQARLKQDQARRSSASSASRASKCFAGSIGGIISGAKRRGASAQEIQLLRSRIEAEGSSASSNEATKLEEREEREEIDKKEEKEVNTPVLRNGHKPTPQKPFFDSEGKKKYRDWVYLSDEQLERVQKYYLDRGLGPPEFNEAVRALDEWFSNNPEMRAKRSDDAKALMGWPLDKALERRQNLLRLEKQKAR